MPESPGDASPALSDGGVILDGTSSAASTGPTPSLEPLRLIAFSLDEEWYAVEIHHVRGIEPETEITPVPQAPPWLAGVFNLHGAILAAIEPRPLLGLPSTNRRRGGRLLVVFQWGGNQAALLVDSVDEMYELSRASLEPQFSAGEGQQPDLTLGQVRVRDRLIGVVDLPALVDSLAIG